MKFSQMPYERPDLDAVKKELTALTKRLEDAATYEEAKAVFLDQQTATKHIGTAETLVSIRHSINTKDEFYDEEMKFWNAAMPELQEYSQLWSMAMLKSPFRADRSHFHHRMSDRGLTRGEILLFAYLCTAFFTVLAFLLESNF